MPLDGTNYERPAVSRNGVELAKLRQLEAALRAPMPDNFMWDFEVLHVPIRRGFLEFLASKPCKTAGCALGLAEELGIFPNAGLLSAEDVMNEKYSLFGLSKKETGRLFGQTEFYGVAEVWDIMPWMVADAIARIIAREEADTAGGA